MTATTTQPVLQVAGIRKAFFGVEVLKGIDFDVRPGEVHGSSARTVQASPPS
ncbi:hypothetical protein AB1285_17885 [Microbacterium sp. NRRL B-14842]|uniref:hypothetical protein n=1 Tax=Microbacterium sp. NRRL B-14842 TaxID=3162881 RepID=UPI003D2C3BBD